MAGGQTIFNGLQSAHDADLIRRQHQIDFEFNWCAYRRRHDPYAKLHTVTTASL